MHQRLEKSRVEKNMIDVVIPVYKPGPEFEELIRRLELQSLKVGKIYLMHTKDGSDLMHSEFLKGYDNIIIEEIEPGEFDHGGTRDRGIRMSDAKYVLCMTQDAVPADSHLTEKLLAGFGRGDVAVSYARQLPRKDCCLLERYTRSFNYPERSVIKTKEDLGRMGIKTYFCSNVCALYQKDVYAEQGGFEKKTIFNEDMIYAAKSIRNGYGISYAAEARVVHSHNYTHMQQFHRNFDLAVSQAQHPDIFGTVKSESEGVRIVKSTALYFVRNKHPFMVVKLVTLSAAKYLGYFLGKHYRILPRAIIMKCTMNPRYWANRKYKK